MLFMYSFTTCITFLPFQARFFGRVNRTFIEFANFLRILFRVRKCQNICLKTDCREGYADGIFLKHIRFHIHATNMHFCHRLQSIKPDFISTLQSSIHKKSFAMLQKKNLNEKSRPIIYSYFFLWDIVNVCFFKENAQRPEKVNVDHSQFVLWCQGHRRCNKFSNAINRKRIRKATKVKLQQVK